MQLELDAGGARRALTGCIVRRGADAAEAEHHVVGSERAAQCGGDVVGFIAQIQAPGQLQPRAFSVSMTLGMCLSWRLPDMISSPMMIAAKFMV